MTLDTFFWMTGASLWAVVAFVALCVAIHIGHGLVCALSLVLFCARGVRKTGGTVTWREIAGGTLRRWDEMIGHHNNGSNKYVLKTGGAWRGPFDFDKV